MLTSEEEKAVDEACSRGGLAEGGWSDEYITCLYFSDKGTCVPPFTPAVESLIKSRPHSKGWHFLLLK